MATEILAVGVAAASSADVVIEPGEQLTVALRDASGPAVTPDARVQILLKDHAGQYFRVDELRWPDRLALVITGAGTYRFTRVNTGASCGVFSG